MTAIEALLTRPFVARVGWGLLHSTWEIAALAFMAVIALWFLRRGSPQSRYLVACATLVLMVLGPIGTVWLIEKDETSGEGRGLVAISVDRQQSRTGDGQENRTLTDEQSKLDGSMATHPGSVAIGFKERVPPLLPWLVVAWVMGVILFSIRLLGGWLVVQRLARRGSHPVGGSRGEDFRHLCRQMAVSRPVRLLESTTAGVPMVVGWIRPIILMPAAAMTGLTAEQFLAILAHELAHVRRLDYLVNLVQSVAETLLFYHPGVWWLGRRIREEREHCCDDLAVATCGDGLVYAKALAAMEEMSSRPWALSPSAAGKPLLGRIGRLLGVAPRADRPAGGLAGMVALGSMASLGLLFVVAPAARTARADVAAGKSLAGVVSDPDGKPARGVDLWLVDTSPTEARAIVLGKAQSGEDGRFRVAWDEDVDSGLRGGRLALWTYRDGAGASPRMLLKSESTSPEPKSPVRITLAPPAESAIRVLDPEGKPITGATIGVIYLHADLVYLPDELVARLATTTDTTGMAVLKAAPDAVEMVRVTSPSHGVQIGHFRDGLKPGLELRLRPVARVEGRVSAANPSSVKGLKVLLSTYPSDRSKGEVYGRAEATTDDQGRFTVPALSTGELTIDLPPPRGSLDRALRPTVTTIAGPGKVEIEIPMKRLISVRGVVREKETGKPVPETTVRLSTRETANPNSIPPTRTDAEGRFTALALPGARSGLYVQAPPPYLRTMRSTEVSIGEADGQALPPIEVERGATLRGRVIDEAGLPIPDATVEGKWRQVIGPAGTNGGTLVATPTAKASTDARGDFLLVGIDPGATVSLEAQAGEARTEGPSTGQAGVADPVTLTVSRSNIVVLSGRVVDATGKPVGNARVRIRSRATDKDALMESGYLRFDDPETIRTAADGSYRTPRQVRRGYAYSAEADIEGGLPAISPWLRLDPATEPTLADVTLTGLRIVRGRVVDGKGQPIVDAVVRVTGDAPTPIRARTDDLGRFTLSGILDGPAFLFVEKAGYRFQGYGIGARTTDVTVALMAEAGPPPEPLASLAPSIPRAEELALVHRVLDPYADKVLKQGTNNARSPVLAILTRIEPARLIALIDQGAFGDARSRDSLRGGLARRLIREQPERALTLLEAIQDPSIRSYSAYEAALGLPAQDRDRKLDLLSRGLVAARTIAEPANRAIRFALIGEQYFDLGEIKLATDLLKEAEAVALDLPRAKAGMASVARGTVAEELSSIDLPAALVLLEGTEGDRDRDLHLGHIAHELAGRNPAEAERVLMMIKDVWPNFRDNYTLRVCHGMAGVDRERALRLASSMTNYRLKARAYGVIALKVAPTDRPAAARLIAEAFAILDRVVEDDKDQWDGLGTACTAAAGLLPIIEEVDPRLLREYVWRTLALRPPLHGSDKRDGIADLSNAQVAAAVARYDRESARAVLEGFGGRAIRRLQGMTIRDQAFEARSVFMAAAVVDPAWAVARVEGLPEEDDLAPGASKSAARLAVADVLSSEGAQRWSIVEWSLLHLWRVGTELY